MADEFIPNFNGSIPVFGLEESSEGLLMSTEAYVIAAVALFMIGFFGFFLNLLVLVLMSREKKLWNPLNTILFNLVCSDFSISILGNPLTFTAAYFRSWIFGRPMCVLYGFFMALLGITSIITLTVLSFERYIMISKPFHSYNLTQSGAKWTILGIWVYSFCVTFPPLIGWGKYVNEAANISCSVNWEHKGLNTTTYIIFLFVMGLGIPIAVIMFSYINIVVTIKQNSTRMGRVTKAETRVAFMIAAMIAAFLFAWMPYAIYALIFAFGNPSWITPGLAVIPSLLAKSSICYNPIIYVGLNTQFQAAWKDLLGCKDKDYNAAEASPNSRFHTRIEGYDDSKVTSMKLMEIGEISVKADL